MERNDYSRATFALILGAALCTFTPKLAAQNPQNPPPSTPPQQGQQQQAESKTFAGKIQKLPSGQFALVTGQTPEGKLSGHFLDDQDNAKKYEGKQVKITGSFDTGTNTIHVADIQAAE